MGLAKVPISERYCRDRRAKAVHVVFATRCCSRKYEQNQSHKVWHRPCIAVTRACGRPTKPSGIVALFATEPSPRGAQSLSNRCTSMYICVCHAVSCRQVRQALDDGKRSVGALRRHFEFKACCGKCTDCLRSMIDEHQQSTTNITAGDPSCKATRPSLSY